MKLKKGIVSVIVLVLFAISMNAVLNLLFYNMNLELAIQQYIFDSAEIISLKSILVVVMNFLNGYFFINLFLKLTKNEINKEKEEETNIKKKKISRIVFLSIFTIIFASFIILFYVLLLQNLVKINTVNPNEYNYWLTGLCNIYVVVCSLALTIIFWLLSCFYEKIHSYNIIKWIRNIVFAISGVILITINLFYYLEIPEWKYLWIEKEFDGEKMIHILGYSDYMDNWNKEFVMPEKINNNDILFYIPTLEYNYSNNVYLNSKITWEQLKEIFKNNSTKRFCRMHKIGNFNEWILDNNQLLNLAKTEMIIFMPLDSDMVFIPENVQSIANTTQLMFWDNERIEVDENNKYFYSVDGILYLTNLCEKYDMIYEEGFRDQNCITRIGKFYKDWIINSDKVKGEIINLAKNDCIISSDFTNDIKFVNNGFSVTVEEENPIYSSIDGNLYNKDGSELISFVNIDYYKGLKLPNTIVEISKEAIDNMVKSCITVTIDEDNPNLIMVGDNIYTRDMSKLIFAKIYDKIDYKGTNYYIKDVEPNIVIEEKLKAVLEKYNVEIRYKEEKNEINYFEYDFEAVLE